VVVNSIEAALQAGAGHDEVMVIGGAELYRQLLPETNTIYLTRIHASLDGDTCFPDIPDTDWRQLERIDHAADERNPYDYSFIQLQRIHSLNRS